MGDIFPSPSHKNTDRRVPAVVSANFLFFFESEKQAVILQTSGVSCRLGSGGFQIPPAVCLRSARNDAGDVYSPSVRRGITVIRPPDWYDDRSAQQLRGLQVVLRFARRYLTAACRHAP